MAVFARRLLSASMLLKWLFTRATGLLALLWLILSTKLCWLGLRMLGKKLPWLKSSDLSPD